MMVTTAQGRRCEDDLCHDVLLLVEIGHTQLAEVGHQGPRVVTGAHGVYRHGTEREVNTLR